ncbi:MAG: signal peptidase II [Hydrogenothermaceae bacterium]|nr:signal peptidase II [Hydrogenothermaceae bacterium]
MKLYYYFGIAVSVIILDLLTKGFAERYLSDKVIEVIPGFFNLVLVWNDGAAFGILADAPEVIRRLILVGSSTIAAIITTVYVLKKHNILTMLEIISLSLICGGAVGNLYDRLILGSVRDFLDFYISNHHWPAFNIADASISIGIALFLFMELFYKKKSKV